MPDPNCCDKCNRPVPAWNNVLKFELCLGEDPIVFFLAYDRHLLPVTENGSIVCKGSPSRAQYLEGQPQDERADYPYKPENEAKYRAAYAKLLAENPIPS